jgi:hypothetical protein
MKTTQQCKRDDREKEAGAVADQHHGSSNRVFRREHTERIRQVANGGEQSEGDPRRDEPSLAARQRRDPRHTGMITWIRQEVTT